MACFEHIIGSHVLLCSGNMQKSVLLFFQRTIIIINSVDIYSDGDSKRLRQENKSGLRSYWYIHELEIGERNDGRTTLEIIFFSVTLQMMSEIY